MANKMGTVSGREVAYHAGKSMNTAAEIRSLASNYTSMSACWARVFGRERRRGRWALNGDRGEHKAIITARIEGRRSG